MRLVVRSPKFAVYDEVLDRDEFKKLWLYAQQENYSGVWSASSWMKVWRAGDGNPMGGPSYSTNDMKPDSPLGKVKDVLVAIGKDHPEIVKPWRDIALRTYLYPRGTKLSWHDDSDVYAAAATYYIHPRWGSTWGGQLLVAEVPTGEDVLKSRPPVGPAIDHTWEDEYINVVGFGQWVACKPNRLVIMAPGVYHSIARVDDDAGDHARCAVVGFYKV